MSRRGLWLFAALGVIWGIPYLLIKVATSGVTPATLVWGRTALGGLLLLPVAIARGALRPAIARWRPVALYPVVERAIPWYLLATAEERLPSSLAALVVASVPIVGAVLARTTGARERLGRVRIAGLATGLAGVAVLVGLDVRTSELGSVAALLVVAVGYALGPWIFHHHLSDLPSLGVVVASLLACALVYTPIAIWQAPHVVPAAKVVASVAGLGVVCTAVAFLVFFGLISEIGPARATVITYVNPAIAVLLGVLVLGEHFTTGTGLGFVLILAGSVLATRTPRSRPQVATS
ncbi:MAG TPA: EamA family transporter [Acidimicrobiales bacterium]|nr:EamA family transporter [Acidimicrobiales bacterium]